MDTTKAKNYLNQVRKIDVLIENKIDEAAYWKAVAMGTTAVTEGERVQSSGSKQKMADAVVRYVDLESEINREIDRLADKRREIVKTIEELPVIEYDILYKRYIEGRGLKEIACDVSEKEDKAYNTAYSWCTTTHGKALVSLEKLLNERERNGKG